MVVHPHGEVFGFLTAPIIKRQGRTRGGQAGGRDYEYALTEGGGECVVAGSGGGWGACAGGELACGERTEPDAVCVLCGRACMYMRSLCAPGLLDGWAKRAGVERVALSECSIRGRMFLHMAAMDRWEAIQ